MHLTFDNPVTLETAKRIHALSRDLKLIEELKAPGIRDIVEAPILSRWSIGPRTEIALVGEVQGHPLRPDSRTIVTSGVFFLDPIAGYARTLSRWYRLGDPL
ncbi:DUF6634 family protein [Devosia sediminis]|uniref:Uncharacterized protein n=1 Tax=Devosia sediminis TaxID=2798801 RepID=A0A934MN45_9HYPH|nr:DUF6634 family protein [Devosia sediminis]MBJ3786391.1 hypothetical protein [Devosia sediminis]